MAELIHKLGIDWKLLIAQAVNFLVLLWLLKKFLYGPIIELLRSRRAAIEDAARKNEEITEAFKQIEQRSQAEYDRAKSQADAIIQDAKKAAKARGEELMKEAEAKIALVIAEAKRRIEEERGKMMDEAGKDIKELVFMVTEKVLREHLPASTHEKFINEAVAALRKQ